MIYRIYINQKNIQIRKKENSKFIVMKIKTSIRMFTRKESVQCRNIIPVMHENNVSVFILRSYTAEDVRRTVIRREEFRGVN